MLLKQPVKDKNLFQMTKFKINVTQMTNILILKNDLMIYDYFTSLVYLHPSIEIAKIY